MSQMTPISLNFEIHSDVFALQIKIRLLFGTCVMATVEFVCNVPEK